MACHTRIPRRRALRSNGACGGGAGSRARGRQTGILHWVDVVSDMVYYDEDDEVYHIKDYTSEKETQAWHDLLNAMCDPAWVGELYTSNAPADPLFWPIHTTAERLLSWKRVLAHKGLVEFDQTWGYTLPSDTPSDWGKVCHWDALTADNKLPVCETATCPGHNADDVVPAMPEFTNQEFYEFMDPFNPALPYVYDNFHFKHCGRLGYDIGL